MEFKDYYAILGVTPETPVDEIKRAYRKLAKKYHPDVSKLPDAEARFKEVNEAWEVIQDPAKRQQYDKLRAGGGQYDFSREHPGNGSFQDNSDFSDFFNAIFGSASREYHGRMRGQDLYAKVSVPLELAYEGGVQSLQLQTKTLQVKIPKGVVNGSQIRLKGQGGEGINGGPPGDLYVDIHFQKHPLFSVHHKDIYVSLPITPWEAALGATVSVPTLGGNVNLKIPKNAQSEQKLRLKERGLPGMPVGNQYVVLQIKTPQANDEKTVQFYQEMAKIMPFNPRENWGKNNA